MSSLHDSALTTFKFEEIESDGEFLFNNHAKRDI